MCLEYVLGVCEILTSRCVYNMKLPYGRYALNYVLHLCTLYRRNRLSRAASLTMYNLEKILYILIIFEYMFYNFYVQYAPA
jgi:hypothetical protein